MFPTLTFNCHLVTWPKALSIFFVSVVMFVPGLSVKDYHPESASYNCTGNVGKGTVPHLFTGVQEDEDDDRLVCCYPATCNGGSIRFCSQDNGTDICIPCPRNGSCNYANVTSDKLFMMIDFCTEPCTRINAVPEVVFYPSSQTKKAGDYLTLLPTIYSDSALTDFTWRFINTTGSYAIANSLTGVSNRRKYKVGTIQNPYLSITNIQPQDHGIYQLLVANLIGLSEVKDVVLNVTAKPIVFMSKVSDNVDAGSAYLISCTITGNLKAMTSTFLFENIRGKVTEINSTVSPSGLMTHTIHNTSSSDSGEYTCQAENSEGKAESILHLTVETPPQIYSPFDGLELEYKLGEQMSMPVWVSTTPHISALPCRNEKNPAKQMFRSVPFNITSGGMTFNYSLTDIKLEDEGTYVCTVSNRLGNNSLSVKIILKQQKARGESLEEQDCKWISYLTIGFTVSIIICVAVALISVHYQTSGRKKTICSHILTILLIYAVAAIVVTSLEIKECSSNKGQIAAIFCAIDIFVLVGTCFFCMEICGKFIANNLFNRMTNH